MSSKLKGRPLDVLAFTTSSALATCSALTLMGTLATLVQDLEVVAPNFNWEDPGNPIALFFGLGGHHLLFLASSCALALTIPWLGGFCTALFYSRAACRRDPWVHTWAGALHALETGVPLGGMMCVGMIAAWTNAAGIFPHAQTGAVVSLTCLGLGFGGLGGLVISGMVGSHMGARAKRWWAKRQKTKAPQGDLYPTGFYPAAPARPGAAGQSLH